MTNVTGLRLPVAALAVLLLLSTSLASAQELALERPGKVPEISGGAEAAMLRQQADPRSIGPYEETDPNAPLFPGAAFDAYNFDDNAALTGGFVFIPPDPIGAAGRDRVIAVVNVGIECRDKTGVLLWRDSLQNMFAPTPGAGTLGTFTFDPKIVWDPYVNRFVVVTLERTDVGSGEASDESRILIAVSRTPTPNSSGPADWIFWGINSKLNIGAGATFADYPGFEVDEEAIYLTMNHFPFSTSPGSFGQRLWVVDKLAFYAGVVPGVWLYDPFAAAGIPSFATTAMPAKVSQPGGIGPGIGTFLMSYGGLTFGGPGGLEALNVIRVDNPLFGAATFTQEFVTISDIEDIGGIFGFPPLSDAPQLGGPVLIEVNDRRLLDLEWRNGSLWGCMTIEPNAAFDPANAGQTTAHWFELDTSAVTSSASPAGLLTLRQEGNCGGEDFAPGMWTFFPSIAVNNAGEMKVGFSGSTQGTYGSAYVAGRIPGEPAGFTGPTGLVRAGVDYYVRTFGGPRNRWGDYSGISIDPAAPGTFWVFNQYAEDRGTPIGGEDGRWGTAWLECSFTPPGTPDLIISVFQVPCCTYWGENLTAQLLVEVRNIGTAASGPAQLRLFASPDPVITVADVPLVNGLVPVPALAAGGFAVLALPPGVAIPGGSLLGANFLGGIVDSGNAIAELDETNNTASAQTEIGRDVYACMRGQAFAGLQGPVSVYTVPDGSGDALSAAQLFTGVGSPPVPFDATILAEVRDEVGAPVTGVNLTLASKFGNFVLCAPPPAADFPTNAIGQTTFSGPLFGGGNTDNPAGDRLLVVGAGGQLIPGMLYGFPELLASNQLGDVFRVDPFSGFSVPLCNIGLSSTEIEWIAANDDGWNQESNGAFAGNVFDWLNPCAPLTPSLPTNGYAFNGLEAIGQRLYGTGITGSCSPSELWIIDPVNGNFIFIGPTGFGPISGLAYDPVCRKLYGSTGCTSTFGPSQLVEIDLGTGAATPVLNIGTQIGSIEFGADGRLYAGGGQADGANLYVIDIPSGSVIPIGPTGIAPSVTGLTLASDSGIDIQINSPDLTQDLRVNLADVGQFAVFFGSPPYDYEIDYVYDGVNNIADLGKFAIAIGAVGPCLPKVAATPIDVADAELLLAFDPSGLRRDVQLEAGRTTTAYLLARGDVARTGVRAWESRIEASANVVIDGVELVEGSLDVGSDGDRMVGLQQVAQSDGDAVVLARVQVRALDDQPGQLWLRPTRASSVRGAAPAVVGDAETRVRAAYVATSSEGAAASINVAFENATPSLASIDLQAIPNPFNPKTEFRFALPQSGRVEVRIFDVSGRLVRTLDGGVMDTGVQVLSWSGDDARGRGVTSGIYFARLLLDGEVQGATEKLTLLK